MGIPVQLSYSSIFRAKDWWASKAAQLMGLVYLYAAWFGMTFGQTLWLLLLSFCTIIGFASTGYLCNDFFDRHKDAIAGKYNFLADKSPLVILLLFVLSHLFLFLPWLYLPFTSATATLIVLQLLLFVVYSLKPIRLKERGWIGVVTDALYAHTIPALLSYYTFAVATGKPIEVLPLLLLLLWQFTTGTRNILLHQYDDVQADRIAMVNNMVASIATTRLFVLFKVLISLEVLFSVLLFALLSYSNYWFVMGIGVIVFFLLLAGIVFYNPGFSVFINTRWRYFPNPVFEKWLPLIFLSISGVSYSSFFLLIPLHLLVFNFSFFVQLNNHVVPTVTNSVVLVIKGVYYRMVIPIRILLSLAVNYLLYYTMKLLFNVDLRKKRVSAWGYIKDRFFR